MNDAFRESAMNKRVANFKNGNFRKKETITIFDKIYTVSIRHIEYKPIDACLYEIDDQGKIISPQFSIITYSLYERIRKAYFLSKE